MDELSRAISALRVGRGTVRRFRRSAPWGVRFSGLTGSGFHLVLRGTGWLLTPDAPPVPLHEGDIVLITAGADHGLSAAPRPLRGLPPVVLGVADTTPGPAEFEFLCGAYRLERGPVHPYLAALPDPIVVPADAGSSPLVRLLDDHESQPGPGVAATRAALLDLVLAHALTRWLATADRRVTPDPAITAILRSVHDDPHAGWTVQALSRAAGLSRSAFTRRFTTATGRTPASYLLGERLERAARLLRETDAPLSSIAREAGYSTEFAFAGAFRREYGIAPGRFRTAHRTG
ncbi:AraC family transcriptional regulator [Virgisporangium aliadipatigenens]|uniref:AraC family transcriptional regulator n=1 Tax=Virgisporangium aliadipatigenens TaxID=741659 RepID=A0A8J4DR26_9ACTN|nr:AraC family transcriptional regulator [Virgisporangium aliadipatigenens]GIJ45912.1 AraC family transcriptional regulator [Virgisporangium aliadipatigenens]